MTGAAARAGSSDPAASTGRSAPASVPAAPETVLMRARDWARDYPKPSAAEKVWGAALEREIGDDLRGAVIRRVRAENRAALVKGIVVTVVAIAIAVGLLFGIRAVVVLPAPTFAVLTAAVTLGVTFVAGRWFRRIHSGTRYAARVLDVHRSFAADAREAAGASLASRRSA